MPRQIPSNGEIIVFGCRGLFLLPGLGPGFFRCFGSPLSILLPDPGLFFILRFFGDLYFALSGSFFGE